MSKDYKAMYEALCKDVRENGTYDICEICIGNTQPCCKSEHPEELECDTCPEELECDTCREKCRCYECENENHWEWRGGTEFEVSADE